MIFQQFYSRGPERVGGGFDRTGPCDWRPLPTIHFVYVYAWLTSTGPVVMVLGFFFYTVCVLRAYYNDSFRLFGY